MNTGSKWAPAPKTAPAEESKKRQLLTWQDQEIEKLSAELENLTESNNKLREAKGLPAKLPPIETQSPQSDGEQISGQAEMYEENIEKQPQLPPLVLPGEEQKNNP